MTTEAFNNTCGNNCYIFSWQFHAIHWVMIWICPAHTLNSLFSGRNYTLRKFILERIACGIQQCHKSFENVPIASVHTHLLYLRSLWDTSLFFLNCKVHIVQWWFCLWTHSKGSFDDQWNKFIRIYCSNCGWLLQISLLLLFSFSFRDYLAQLTSNHLCKSDPKTPVTFSNSVVQSYSVRCWTVLSLICPLVLQGWENPWMRKVHSLEE